MNPNFKRYVPMTHTITTETPEQHRLIADAVARVEQIKTTDRAKMKLRKAAWRKRGAPESGNVRRTQEQVRQDDEARMICEDIGVPVEEFDYALSLNKGDFPATLADFRQRRDEVRTRPEPIPVLDISDMDIRRLLGQLIANHGVKSVNAASARLLEGAENVRDCAEDPVVRTQIIANLEHALAGNFGDFT